MFGAVLDGAIMMADALDDDDEIFVYMGGDQDVPMGVRRARIHKSVKIVRRRAFHCRYQLIYVEFHDEVEIIEEEAFFYCYFLRGPIKLLGVKIVEKKAFHTCRALTNNVEFGDKLETIGNHAFYNCISLRTSQNAVCEEHWNPGVHTMQQVI